MTRHAIAPLLVAALALVAAPAAAQTPDGATVVDRAVAAADSGDALARHDVIRASIREEETLSDGSTEVKEFTVLLQGGRLQNARLELSPDVSVVLHKGTGWATIRGQLDTRPTAARMAGGTVRQKIFPLLLPFSLQLEGVRLGAVSSTTFDDRPAWAVDATFDPAFFAAPSLSTTWMLYFDRSSSKVLGAEFYPPEELRGPGAEGVRYRILTWKSVDGIDLPGQVLLEGIDFNGAPNGHVRVTKIEYGDGGPFDPALFIDPATLEKLDAGDVE
ncbi:MAG TPA: hypothetical protein VLT32_08810 [Candidatus Sulfomarinibacteraceae bacterium]|nr:hypothetical protein [Candidatus Sulfomarinibacteraceae bacterium]